MPVVNNVTVQQIDTDDVGGGGSGVAGEAVIFVYGFFGVTPYYIFASLII